MFGHRYFGARYFAPRYFGDGGNDAPVLTGGRYIPVIPRVPTMPIIGRRRCV